MQKFKEAIMLKILGFDIGISSIGWALVENGSLKDCGVRIFTKAEHPKDGSSLALPRREARGSRRRLARRKGRIYALKSLISKEFELKLEDYLADDGTLPKAFSGKLLSPYQLRYEALHRKLEKEEFARVILHIAKHRGYGNKHAKNDDSDNESGQIKKAISQNVKAMQDKGYESAGVFLYKEFYQKVRDFSEIKPAEKNTQKTQEFINVRNKKENYARCLDQKALQDELNLIFDKQREFNFTLSDKTYKVIDEKGEVKELDFKEAILEIAFFQRPLKSFESKVGNCTFFSDERRAPKHSLSAMEFVALGKINNLLASLSKISGEVYSKEKVNELLSIVMDKGEISYKKLRQILILDEKIRFPKDVKLDYTKDDAEKAKFIEFGKLKAFKKAFGGSFEGFSRKMLDEIATLITLNKSKDELKNKLQKYENLNENQREDLSNLNFDKFINLSFKALNRILPFMRADAENECLRYDEAVQKAGLKEAAKRTSKGDFLPPLNEYEPYLANPVVARALSEYRKVLNALLKKYGKVHKIHLEFTREAGISSKKRNEITNKQNKQFKANEEAKKRCEELGLEKTAINILKCKLWQQQSEICVYSGTKIRPEDLQNPNALQIDHIYPYSRSFDDSQNNKVLVFTRENQEKGNQTPFEAWGGTEKWTKIQALVKIMDKSKKKDEKIQQDEENSKKPKLDPSKAIRILNENFTEKEAGFIPRNIVDTSYIAKLTAAYTDDNITFLPLVENEDTSLGRGILGSKRHITVVSGNLTATMRHHWGLENILSQSGEKDRSNHLHHALDAIIIAYANDSLVKAFSDFKKTKEQNKAKLLAKEMQESEYKTSRRFFAPANFENNEAFRKEVERKILGDDENSGIFVSKPPRKRARGALHKESYGSICKENDEWVAKIKIQKEEKNGGKTNDKERYEILYKGEENIKNAFKWGKIRRLNKRNDTIQIGDKFARNERIIRLDIFKDKKGKFYGVPIYTMDFALGVLPNMACPTSVTDKKTQNLVEWVVLDSSYVFCFSLFPNDLILIKKSGMDEGVYCYYENFNPSNSSLTIAKHDNKAKEDLSDLSEDEKILFKHKAEKGVVKIIGEGVGIRNLKIFEKYQVSPLGEVKKAEFKERENISLKSSPKAQNEL